MKGMAAAAAAYAVSIGGASTSVTRTTTDAMTSVPNHVVSEAPTSTIPTGPVPTSIDPSLEHVLPNGITVYGTEAVASQLATAVYDYPDIWKDRGTTVDIPEAEWMPISIKPGASVKAARVYPLGQRDREVIDETFDKMHDQGKMEWSLQPTPFSFPCFVVWRNHPAGRKGRVVVDIRELNRIAEADTYPLPAQADIVGLVAGYEYISTVDAVGWFHQFLVQRGDRSKFTVVSHRGQEQSNVALMGFKNSPPYVQRQTDKLLRPFRTFARAYVDDIVIFSKTLHEHIEHLRQVFQLFTEKRVSLAPSKSFIGYPSIQLLGQRVDSLGLTTSEEKVAAIAALKFPRSLSDLDHFLGLTGWLRHCVHRYAQKALPLQARKTALTRQLPKHDGKRSVIGPVRKKHAIKLVLDNPSDEEIAAFKLLQRELGSPISLVHFSPDRRLYIDLDASKKWGFAAMVYHLLGDPEDQGEATTIARTSVQPIMYLSKMLNSAEHNYWPTELEVAGIVWVVRKIRHMIESSKKPPTIIYTDHSAAVPISRQTTLTTSSTDKLNLRLVRASQYLSSFNIALRHKAGKSNVVPDALSRLPAHIPQMDDVNKEGILDILYGHPVKVANEELDGIPTQVTYHVTLVEMSDDFKQRLKRAYAEDKHWSAILKMLNQRAASASRPTTEIPSTSNESTSEATVVAMPNTPVVEAEPGPTPPRGLQFECRDELVYYLAGDGKQRLCIPKAMQGEVFKLAHDQTHHGGFQRTYDRLCHSVYIRRMVKHLKHYIEHCPECQLNQTKRHRPYGELNPIISPPIPFHTIAMDFVVGLPLSKGCNALLTITCKFTKKILLIPGHDTWDAAQWAEAVLVALIDHDWGIPKEIISDRDSKFMSDFWKAVFNKLDTTMLTSTAYHPQTDGQSERTNQTIEIALRFHITAAPGDEWKDVLPFLQAESNNVVHATTGYAPNELAYGFRVNDNLAMLADLPPEDYSRLRQLKREDAESAMAFANALSKVRYDAVHEAINIKVGDSVYLRLHQGYTIPGLANHKLSHQRVGPFPVLEKIGKLAFRLRLPPIMKIHPVISVAQLEPKPPGTDPYNRSLNSEPPPVAEADSEAPFYALERILDKRISRGQTYYLVKWKGYGNEHNVWYPVRALDDAEELIAEYEARTRRRVPQGRRVRMPGRRRTSNEAAPTITDLATEASPSQPISHQPEIEVRIPRRTTPRSTTPARREASRRQPSRQARRLEGYQEL